MFASKKCLLITIIFLDNVLKLWIKLIKSRNDNAMEKFYRFSTFQKLIFLVEISKISEIFGKMKMPTRSCSTSYPSGNQVDGSPLVANTKTIAKRARVGPRTPVLLTMKMLFYIMFVSNMCLGITIIILVHVLKLWIEQIK